ncbi:uncharacterized protein LOC119363085 [Triticum dicoccoides]|uniref:uncharacterized protein LOC119363085 n=1 Tax=Triticum dicoccoides TaxID=85692 RepID=UPI00188F3B9E|nr:uncharacterized protein LOC119363085 [Triticum dicoccoides]
MEIASLVNLLRENQSDILQFDPEIARKITSLRSEIACQKLARERKASVPEAKCTVARRRKKFAAVRRVAEKEENMAGQEGVDLPNCDTQSMSFLVSCISEQMPERCDQKEIDSGKIKPASGFISNSEHVYLPHGGEDEGERLNCLFSYILQRTDALCDEIASMASILAKISIPVISYYKVFDQLNAAQRLSKISLDILHSTANADKKMADQNVEDQRAEEDKGKSSTHCFENQGTKQHVDASVTDQTMGLCKSNMETPQMAAYCPDGQMTDEEDEHFVAADPISGLCDQATVHSHENQSTTEYMEMVDPMTDEGQSSTETHASRMMDGGNSSSEGKSSNEGQSSTETHASRVMDEGNSSNEGKSSNESKSSTKAVVMVLDSDEEHEVQGMTMEMRKYLKMLECEEEEEEGKMTPEDLAMADQFEKELLEMEANFLKVQEQDDKDTPNWISVSHQDEAEEMELEDRLFARRRKGWESAWGDRSDFEDLTLLSPMHFTHCTLGLIPYTASTVSALQIYSVKIVETKGKLKWPLYVYGVVAARDAVDHNRNILFSRQREDYQELTLEDPFLHLTGPSRAIVAVDNVDFEIQLKVKGTTWSGDKALISHFQTYPGDREGLDTALFSNSFCTIELCFERLTETVQATILSVCVVEGWPSPFEYGGRIMCSSPPQEVKDPLSRHVVLVDSHDFDGEMPMGSAGYVDLSRHVVSVELGHNLQFVIQAYSQSGAIARQSRLTFRTKYCNISRGICEIGDSKVEITVAWSQLIKSKMEIL